MLNLLNRIFTAMKFIFKKKLKISTRFIDSQIRDFEYSFSQDELDQYHEVIAVANQRQGFFEGTIHPLFYTKISWRITEHLNELLEIPIDPRILDTIVHQSEDITVERCLSGPCQLLVKVKIWRITPHARGTKMTLRLQYFSEGKLMATQYTGGLFLGVRCLGEERILGALPHTEIVAENAIWEHAFLVDNQLPYTYAKKAEIDAPIHTNPAFAKSIGLPDIILQGTCTLARATNQVLNAQHRGHPLKIRRISAKFTGMVIPPASLNVRILKREKSFIYFDVINENGDGIIKGGQIFINTNDTNT